MLVGGSISPANSKKERVDNMKDCVWCGEKVKHSLEHVECSIKNVITNYKGTSLYDMAKTMHPELFKKNEEELRGKIQ
jgi:hypothetical protein